MTLMGEMTKLEGTLTPLTSVSYAPQEPWVMSTTVRDNILFGSPMDVQRYEEIIHACALEQVQNIMCVSEINEQKYVKPVMPRNIYILVICFRT